MSKKDDPKSKGETLQNSDSNQNRRDIIKNSAVVAGVAAASMAVPSISEAAKTDLELKNPYRPNPSVGFSLPKYYKPWPAIKNRNMFLTAFITWVLSTGSLSG